MNDQDLLARIVSEPGILAGKPIICGTRLSVEYILNLLAHDASQDEILSEYDGLVPEDFTACLLFAVQARQH